MRSQRDRGNLVSVRWLLGAMLVAGVLGAACERGGASADDSDAPSTEPGGTEGNPLTPGGSGPGDEGCTTLIPEQRLVRLTLAEIVQSMRTLLDNALADQLASSFGVGGVSTRSFPPLAAPQEGTFVTEAVWSKSEGMGQAAAQYVVDNYARVTGCQATDVSDACALEYALGLAQRAFRRPLDQPDRDSLTQVYTESKALGAAVPEALQQMVWAIFTSPHFLYRTELGAAVGPTAQGTEVTLTPYEVASQIAFFLSAGPPDAALLDAAARGSLATAEGIESEVDRMLADPAVQENLGYALASYFGINNLGSVVIDSSRVPEFTVGLREAMYRETQDFLKSALWGGTLDELITSRQTVVNPALAELYGIPFPAGGGTSDTFVQIELPAVRSGLLTQAGFLTARARPDTDSVVSRALMISSTLLCQNNPSAPPAALAAEIASVREAFADKTERELSEYRTSTSPCSGCHATFDAFGLVLQNFDLIGRYRTADEEGRPIDASAILPARAGGAEVQDVVEFARVVAENGTFAKCMTRNLMKYALAQGNVELNDCAVRDVTERVLAGDATFSSMIREIATSRTFLVRTSGGTP